MIYCYLIYVCNTHSSQRDQQSLVVLKQQIPTNVLPAYSLQWCYRAIIYTQWLASVARYVANCVLISLRRKSILLLLVFGNLAMRPCSELKYQIFFQFLCKLNSQGDSAFDCQILPVQAGIWQFSLWLPHMQNYTYFLLVLFLVCLSPAQFLSFSFFCSEETKNINDLLYRNTMSSNNTSVGVVYNLPVLKCAKDDFIVLELFQIVEKVKAHLPVVKQETVSEPLFFYR